MVATLLVLLVQEAYDQTAPWKAYIDRVEKAYAMEIRWSRLTKQTVTCGGRALPFTDHFILVMRKPDFVKLEESNVSQVIWNGSAGIQLDLKAKTFKRLSQRPHLEAAQFLYLPRLSWLKGNGERPTAKVTASESNGVKWRTVSFKSQAVDAGIGYDYTFSDRTGLSALARTEHRVMVGWRGLLEYRVQSFDTDRMILTTEFSIEPPKEFKEAG